MAVSCTPSSQYPADAGWGSQGCLRLWTTQLLVGAELRAGAPDCGQAVPSGCMWSGHSYLSHVVSGCQDDTRHGLTPPAF